MVKSMTGFGRFEVSTAERKMTVEIKSVNHRYLDLNVKLPKKLNFFETDIRNLLKKHVERGKVDIYITYEDYSESSVCVKYNKELAREYLANIREIQKEFDLNEDFGAASLSRYPDVLVMEEQAVDEEELWKILEEALKGALERFTQSRKQEGEHLKQDLLAKLENMLKSVSFIEERSPEILKEYREKLTNKVKELLAESDGYVSAIAAESVGLAAQIGG